MRVAEAAGFSEALALNQAMLVDFLLSCTGRVKGLEIRSGPELDLAEASIPQRVPA